jgi:anti-sigma B factor antagonist
MQTQRVTQKTTTRRTDQLVGRRWRPSVTDKAQSLDGGTGVFLAEVVEDHSANGGGPRLVVNVVGEVDVATAPALEAALEVAFAGGSIVVVNLAGVTFFSVSGIGELVRARMRFHADANQLVVTNASPTVRRVFSICGLEHLLGE